MRTRRSRWLRRWGRWASKLPPLPSSRVPETQHADESSILELFRADFGGGGGGPGGPGGGVRVMTGPNPLAMLSTLLNFDRHGDAVYSQEELDRVISQLIDQKDRKSVV